MIALTEPKPPLMDISRSYLRRAKGYISRSIALLRKQDIDVDTETGRGTLRTRNSLLTSISSMIARTAGIVASLITLPIALHHLGLERYGLLATVASMAGVLAFSDFGIGNSLINVIARSEPDNTDDVTASISTAFYVLLGVALFLIGGTLVVIHSGIDMAHVLNLKSPQAIYDVNSSIIIFVICFALNMPFGIVQKVQLGYQCGYYFSNWVAIGSLATIPAVIIAARLNMGTGAFLFATVGMQLIASMSNHTWYFSKHSELWPRFFRVRFYIGMELISSGFFFLGVQSISLMLLLSDNLIVAHILGASSVGILAIPVRLVSLVGIIPSFFVIPLWAAYGEAESRGHYAWIKKTLRSSNIITNSIAAILSLMLLLFGHVFIRHWVGKDIFVSKPLIAGVTLAAFLVCANAANSIFLMGTGRLKVSLLMVIAMFCMATTMKIFLIHGAGLASIGWITSAAQLICLNIPTFLYVRHITRQYPDRSKDGPLAFAGEIA